MQFDVPHYRQEFFLEENAGNNGFDYEHRSESGPSPSLRIAPLKQVPDSRVAMASLHPGRNVSLELEIEGKIKSFAGLENFLIFPNPTHPDRPVVIFDNHNHAFYFWHWAKQTFQLSPPLTLIHIDQHKDSRLPATMLSREDAKNLDLVFEYTNHTLNVGNFVPPAIKTGLLGDIITIDSSASLNTFVTPVPPFILDLDLDFFAPEFDYIDRHKKLCLIRSLLPAAEIVTIATSPFFVDLEIALRALREIFMEN